MTLCLSVWLILTLLLGGLYNFQTPSIEHAGPGCYDESYLAYLRVVVQKASDYGFSLYIDPHQDVWSRFSGGDGAPAWTLEMVGFELENLSTVGAATLHAIHGNPFPHMIWGTNYGKLASATMFTLFWGSEDFAPKTKIAGESAKHFLQRHYIAAFKHLANALCDVPQVLGYGIINEPSPGFIGMDNLNHKAHALLLRGRSPSAFEGMRLGSGLSEQVEVWELGWRGLHLKRLDTVNHQQVRAWQKDKPPVWQENGVWSHKEGQSELLNPQHFAYVKGHEVNFYRDYYLPFAKNYIAALREVHPGAYFFIEGVPADPTFYWQGDEPIIHAPHWYDVATLVSKHYNPWLSYDIQKNRLILGKRQINKCFSEQVSTMKSLTKERLNNTPMLIGEVGIPMDMHGKRAYHSGDFSKQIKALDRSLRVMEQNLVSYTPIALTVMIICGRSTELLGHIQKILANYQDSIDFRLIGFTKKLPRFMAAADILVGKLGGLTSSEALAAGLPFAIVTPYPLQEEANANFLLENGAGMRIEPLSVFGYKLERFFADQERQYRMQKAAKELARVYAANEIAKDLYKELSEADN